jgi:hypothetical protein
MKACLVVLAALLTAGCSGLKTYSNDAPKNVRVATQTDGARAALHVHEITGQCETRYEGTVSLDQPSIEVGVPDGRRTFVVVSFDTSSFLGGQRGTSVGTVLTPRPGYRYELAVRYKQDMYDVALREIDRKGAARELPRRGLGC